MPLDPAYPPARLAGMLEDAGARVVLTAGAGAGPGRQRAGTPSWPGKAKPTRTAPSTWCAWTTPWKPWRSPPARIPLPGSGGPRGPGLRRLHLRLHRAPQGGGRHPPGDQPPGLQHGLHHPDARRPDGPRLEPLLRRATYSSCGGPLIHGARLVVVDPATALPPGPGGPLIRRGADRGQVPHHSPLKPARGDRSGRLRHHAPPQLRGEADPPRPPTVLRAGPPEALLNVYGPTECTTFATWHLLEEPPAEADNLPIGRPIANTEAYVLDARRQPGPGRRPRRAVPGRRRAGAGLPGAPRA